ncbi:nuclear transport factor 2 family protein [Pseudooceanicola nitratireducens]|uniref:nuclear transport factor 2 family protein n=1 Tax=Pseudooceanicola nitratireducens TaxID=517719 RepID=UPI0023F3164B|nr:nuclear transport factor 2 family protein [Pseudooceanicola nitratireducens]
MTDEDLRNSLVEIMDREAIRDCLYRYCRGIDRADEASVRSAYWPEAIDNHGFYNGPVAGFIQAAQRVWASGARNIHAVTNVLIEFTGPGKAVVESYFIGYQRGKGVSGTEKQELLVGHYADLFEKRGREWRIIERNVVFDWVDEQPVPTGSEEERFAHRKPIGGAYPNDRIYELLAQHRP